MKLIYIKPGFSVKVDDTDFNLLSQWKWHLTSKGYAARRIYIKGNGYKQKTRIVLMHREILSACVGTQVDHTNGDKLDNRRINIRLCSASQNQSNRGVQNNNTSGYKGVSWHKQNGLWDVLIWVNKQRIRVGLFKDKLEAAMAYNRAAEQYHGEFARLNDITLTPTVGTTRVAVT